MSIKREVVDVETTATLSNGVFQQKFRFTNPLCFVNLNLLSEALWCNNCDTSLALRNCQEQRPWKDSFLLKIKCSQCSQEKSVALCNDDPDNECINIQESCPSSDVTATSGETLVLNSTENEKSRKGKSPKAPLKKKRGRPPGSKNKPIRSPQKLQIEQRKRRKVKEEDVDEEVPLVKRIRIRTPVPPSVSHTLNTAEPTFSDDDDDEDKNFTRLNSPDQDLQQSPRNNDSCSSEDEEDLCENKERKPMQCQYCPKSYARKNQHARHMKNDHPEVRAFFCEICSEEFTTIYFLRKHKMEFHLPENSPKCETCSQAFLTLEMLNAHKLKHLPKEARQFKCNRCSKKFFEAKRLRVHTLRFHQKNEGNFKCAHCPRGYDAKRKLLRHILEHVQDDIYAIKHGNEYARWKCEYCDKIFKNMGRQLVHMRECHPEFKAMICGWCGEQCTTVKSFQKHRRMNHRTDSLYVCDECGKPTLNPKKLALHKLSHRTDNEGKEFLCSYCPRAFAENSALVDHIKRFHIITTYYCEHCPKTFKMKFNIRRHMQLHTGVFRHSCPYCGANFVAADGRDHHIRNCHRFMCVVCSSIFPTKDEVVMHRIRDHPNSGRAREGDPIFEKITDYNCEICFRYLSSKQALNTHLRTHMKRKSKEADYSISE